MDQIQKELASSQDEQRTLNNKIHDLERQNSELRGQLEEAIHQKKLELTNARMEAVKIRGELEREKDGLFSEFEGEVFCDWRQFFLWGIGLSSQILNKENYDRFDLLPLFPLLTLLNPLPSPKTLPAHVSSQILL